MMQHRRFTFRDKYNCVNVYSEYTEEEVLNRLAELEDKIESGVLKEQKIGKWFLMKEPDGRPRAFCCSICYEESSYSEFDSGYKYCPDCGAKME